ncbi:MAG: LCP family protein [Nocardioides sp.]
MSEVSPESEPVGDPARDRRGEPSGPQGEPEPGEPRRGSSVWRIVGVATLVLTLTAAMATAYGYRRLTVNLTSDNAQERLFDRPDAATVKGSKQPLNILLMGSDTREGEGNRIDEESGAARSDTTILIHLAANRERAYAISIPRDTMVARGECKLEDGRTLPATDRVAWNDAFAAGGPGCTMQQFEQLTGIRLQHHVIVDFNGFKGMVDAIDGVDVCVPEPVDDPEHGIRLAAGPQTLRGDEALAYVRQRYGSADPSDLNRVKRQQAFMASMAKKIISGETLTRPDRVLALTDVVTKSLQVDESLASVNALSDLALEFSDVGLGKIQFFTIPVVDDPLDKNRVALTAEAPEIWALIAADDKLPRRLKSETIKASEPTAPGKDATNARRRGLCG